MSDLYWKCSLISIFTPGILFLMMDLFHYCTGWLQFSWWDLGVTCLCVLLFPVLVIGISLYDGWMELWGRIDEDFSRQTKQWKLFEAIGG